MTYDVIVGLWNRSREVSVHTRADDSQSSRLFDVTTITKRTLSLSTSSQIISLKTRKKNLFDF